MDTLTYNIMYKYAVLLSRSRSRAFRALWSRSRFEFFSPAPAPVERGFFFVNSCIFSLILLHLAHHCQQLFRKLSTHTVFCTLEIHYCLYFQIHRIRIKNKSNAVLLCYD